MSDRIGHAATAGYVLIAVDEDGSRMGLVGHYAYVYDTVEEALEEASWRQFDAPQVCALVPVELLDGERSNG